MPDWLTGDLVLAGLVAVLFWVASRRINRISYEIEQALRHQRDQNAMARDFMIQQVSTIRTPELFAEEHLAAIAHPTSPLAKKWRRSPKSPKGDEGNTS